MSKFSRKNSKWLKNLLTKQTIEKTVFKILNLKFSTLLVLKNYQNKKRDNKND